MVLSYKNINLTNVYCIYIMNTKVCFSKLEEEKNPLLSCHQLLI